MIPLAIILFFMLLIVLSVLVVCRLGWDLDVPDADKDNRGEK